MKPHYSNTNNPIDFPKSKNKMNERIKELAEQANSHHDNFFDLNYKELDVFLEKFAELIVGECLEQVWYTREDSINGNVSEVIKQRIEQHFGVEE